jgi:D-sedoheptulose 7-phosphate isomerase
MRNQIVKSLNNALKVLQDINGNNDIIADIQLCAEMLINTYKNKGNIFVCGNGGSHADALHFAEELTGRFRANREPLGALALGEATHTSCTANDYGFEAGLARQFYGLVKANDVLIVLSTSGYSKNILECVSVAQQLQIPVLGLLGRTGGNLVHRCNTSIILSGDTSDRIQEGHMLILHILVEMVERELFPENYLEI